MTETRDMSLGGRVFRVPALPFAYNIEAYPRLQKLHNNGFIARWFSRTDNVSDDDMADLGIVLLACAKAADPEFAVDAFRALPITPPEMWAGFCVARVQCGLWVPFPEGIDQGEAEGEPRPPTSTSAESLES